MARNYFISSTAPSGTTTTELNAAYKAAEAATPPATATSPGAVAGDWPSYNKTPNSERYSELDQINTKSILRMSGKLKVFVHLTHTI